MKILTSKIDSSVNFITQAEVGYFEARYVCRPESDYFIVYLSSQSGCNRACKMCHLTASKQTKFVDASVEMFIEQAESVLKHWDELKLNHKKVHFNFMARGEPLYCKTILENADEVLLKLNELAVQRGLEPKFLISTIIPNKFEKLEFEDVFKKIKPEIYYSIYSIDPEFRKNWLPRALNPELAVRKLAKWQIHSGKTPKMHFAFIKGENDSDQNMHDICGLFRKFGLTVDFNVVRYNPPMMKLYMHTEESSEEKIQKAVELFQTYFPKARVKIVPRVGFDVKASCGMFVK